MTADKTIDVFVPEFCRVRIEHQPLSFSSAAIGGHRRPSALPALTAQLK